MDENILGFFFIKSLGISYFSWFILFAKTHEKRNSRYTSNEWSLQKKLWMKKTKF